MNIKTVVNVNNFFKFFSVIKKVQVSHSSDCLTITDICLYSKNGTSSKKELTVQFSRTVLMMKNHH